MDILGWLSGVSQKVAADFLDFLKWIVPIVGPPVIAWLRSKNLCWATIVLDTVVGWACLYIILYGLSTEAMTSFSWWVYFVAVGSLVFFVILDWRRNRQVTAPPELTEVGPSAPASTSLCDEANKGKIAAVFRNGTLADENLQKIARDLFKRVNQGESRENRISAKIMKRSSAIPCFLAHEILCCVLEKKKESFPLLRRYLEDFFLAYFRLVLDIQDLEDSAGRETPPDRIHVIWQEHHRLFLDGLRTLFAEPDFSVSRARIEESRRADDRWDR